MVNKLEQPLNKLPDLHRQDEPRRRAETASTRSRTVGCAKPGTHWGMNTQALLGGDFGTDGENLDSTPLAMQPHQNSMARTRGRGRVRGSCFGIASSRVCSGALTQMTQVKWRGNVCAYCQTPINVAWSQAAMGLMFCCEMPDIPIAPDSGTVWHRYIHIYI